MTFVDSGAWIALYSLRDQHHMGARVMYGELGQRQTKILASDYVIDESVTRLRYDAGFPAAELADGWIVLFVVINTCNVSLSMKVSPSSLP